MNDEKIDAWVDAHFDEEVHFLQEMVRVPTDTPPGNNAPHAERTALLLERMGLVAESHAVPASEVHAQGMQSITNLIVRRLYGAGGPTIALNAHGDVVPPGEGWTHDPYGGEVVDGKLYGRASAVSKSDFASYTFALRRGVQFHTTDWFKPTRAFNADDVLFTFARLLDPKHPFQQSYATLSPYVEALGWRKLVQRVERVGDYEVRIQLATVDASFLSPLTYAFAGIQSAEYGAQLLAQNKAAQISRLPVGTGPFIFKSYQQDSVLRYRRHPSYYRTDVPVVDQLVFAITIDRNVRTQRLLANECDIAVMSNPVELAELAKNPALALVSQPGLNVGFLAFNLKKPPLDRLDVRQALDMAIDKPTLVKTIFGNTGEVAVSPMPSACLLYTSDAADE